ncbi:hypothetical protein MMC25_001155 [Agyrium rufum]|nr:hypothetical protein [Agyrium rufum]
MSCNLFVSELTQTHKSSSLKLLSNCTIQVEPDANGSSSPQTFSSVEELIDSKAWVCRGNGLTLCLSFRNELGGDHSIEPAFIEHIGVVIENAKLWSQLHLQASLLPPDQHLNLTTDTISQVLLALKHGDHVIQPKPDGPLNRSIIPASIKPPPRVPVVRLKSVHFELSFSTTKQLNVLKLPKIGQSIADEVAVESSDEDEQMLDRLSIQDSCSVRSDSRHLSDVHQAFNSKDDNHLPCLSKSTFSQAWNCLEPEGEHFSHEHDELDCASSLPFSDGELSDTPMSSFEAASKAETSNAAQNTRVEMVDRALRYALGGRRAIPPMLRYQIICKANQENLSSIAPALFRLGYLDNLAQRNRFLSGIAHDLTAIHNRAKSNALRKSIDSLLDSENRLLSVVEVPSDTTGTVLNSRVEKPSLCIIGKDQTTVPPDASTIYSTLHRRLWAMIQSTSYKIGSPKKLMPMLELHEDVKQSTSEAVEDTALPPINASSPAEDYHDDFDWHSDVLDHASLSDESEDDLDEMLFSSGSELAEEDDGFDAEMLLDIDDEGSLLEAEMLAD